MSSGCGDVISIEDLKTAKQHQIFEAEVITGKAGGVASGADIDFATNQVTGQVQKTLPAILRDSGFRPAPFTFATGGSLGVNDADLAVLWPLSSGGDGNYYAWKGSLPKTIPAASSPATTGGISSSGWVAVSEAALRSDLASASTGNGANLVADTTRSSTVQKTLNEAANGLYPETSVITTGFLADKTNLKVGKPVTVDDTDNQGAKIPAGMTVSGVTSGQNAITTPKQTQSALRLDGDNITIKSVKGIGSADNNNTATAEFITSRMIDAVAGVKIKNLVVDDVLMENFTTGIALSGVNKAIINNVRARSMRYSPTGLNSAGGYLLVCGGNAKHVVANNIQHTLVPGADRHTLYISAASADSLGWSYWNVNNVDSDYSANSVTNAGVSGVPFAMSPIHVRNGQNLNLNNHMVEGYICSAMDYENQFGSINNTNVNNVVATDTQSFQNGSLIDQGALRLGYDQYTNFNRHHNFNNFIVKMIRGLDNSGVKMAAGTDNGVWGSKLQHVNFNNGNVAVESGYAMKLYNSSYININNLTDELIDTTSGLNSVYLNGCSNITIGNIQSNRAPTGSKERVYTIINSTEITCRFPRIIELLVVNGAVTVSSDRWDMLGGVPSFSGNTLRVPVVGHVSTNAKRTCKLENRTLSNVKGVRAVDFDANTLQIGFWDTSTNAQAPAANTNNAIVIHFDC